jgi:hypothetical protein
MTNSDLLRAQLFIHAVLPLLSTVAAAQPKLLLGSDHSKLIYIGLIQGGLGANLMLSSTQLLVESNPQPPPTGLAILFKTPEQLNAFFSGKPCLPHIQGALKHPKLLFSVMRLLMSLKLLQPTEKQPQQLIDQTLKVRLLLQLVVRALAQLARSGEGEFCQWVSKSPERVFQWTVGETNAHHCAVFLRMAHGQIQVGSGIYPHRAPFVHYAFRDVPAALKMLTSPSSQMSGLQEGLLQTTGSPEYTRKLALHMQQIDALLLG